MPVKHRRFGGARLLVLLVMSLIVALGLSVFGGSRVVRAAPVTAQSATVTFNYLAGAGFLCSLSPTACPDVARAANGDTIRLSGQGTLSIHPDAATGSGTFLHQDASGTVKGQGTWTAQQLLSFVSYGTSPPFPSTFEGGAALVLIHLVPTAGGSGFNALLRITCAVGSPPAGAQEGIRLNVQDIINFNEQVSGFTLFIRTSP